MNQAPPAMKRIFVLSLSTLLSAALFSQGVAINEDGSSPDASAMLDVQGADKGILVPRMTYAEIAAITSPADGLLAYATDSAAFYFYDGSSWGKIANQFQLGGSTDYSEFEFDGTLVFNGNASTWEDIQVPGFSVITQGSADPDLEIFKDNTRAYAFDDNTEQEVFFTVQLPHSMKQGSTIYPHVHFSTATGGSGTEVVRWVLEYFWANIDQVYSGATASTAAGTETIASNAYTHQVTKSFDSITPGAGTQDKISSILICRLYRDVDVANDFTGDVYFLQFDIHYEKNTTGSRLQFIK